MGTYGDKPFGIRELVIANAGNTVQVALPAAQKLGFTERLTTGEMRGNDRIVALVSFVDAVEFSIEAGGISLEAYGIMTGRDTTETGTTPNAMKTYNIVGAECYPYFKIYGKAVGDDCTGDIHVLLYKCKLTSPLEGEFSDGSFFVTKCAGIALKDATQAKIGAIIQHETAAVLPAVTA